MQCQLCGQPLPEGVRVCDRCGGPVPQPQPVGVSGGGTAVTPERGWPGAGYGPSHPPLSPAELLPPPAPPPVRPRRSPPPPRRARKAQGPPGWLAVVTALALVATGLLAGAYYDRFDPLALRDTLWKAEAPPAVPPVPSEEPLSVTPPEAFTPPTGPLTRGAPLGGERDNAARLLQAAAVITGGLSERDGLSGEALTAFLWQALLCAGPTDRQFTPAQGGGYYLSAADVNDLCREALGPDTVPSAVSIPAFSADGAGYTWRDTFTDRWRADIFRWEPQPDGGVSVSFNLLYLGMLYDTFVLRGEALLYPNEQPVYYRFRLAQLTWADQSALAPNRVTASSTLPNVGGNSYTPDNLIDGDPTTAWIEGAPDEGVGAWVELVFDTTREITGLTIVNGYGKEDKTMRQNGRVERILVECGGERMEFTLADVDYHPGGDYQSIPFGRAVQAALVRITILSVYPGSQYSDTCVSEIEVF